MRNGIHFALDQRQTNVSNSPEKRDGKLDWNDEVNKEQTEFTEKNTVDTICNATNDEALKESSVSTINQSISAHINLVHNQLVSHFRSVANSIEENVQSSLKEQIPRLKIRLGISRISSTRRIIPSAHTTSFEITGTLQVMNLFDVKKLLIIG